MALDKGKLRRKFQANWEKYYKINFLIEKGFKRKQCKVCGNFFWTTNEEKVTCGDPNCDGYQFIGTPLGKKMDYIQTWKSIEKYFVENGHTSIPRYPVTARWRSDLFFTSASIVDFQPYVITGEVDPPANPLVVPQVCLRFNDVPNVGVTGRHHTSFIMIGQHAFNTEKTGLFYWKEDAIKHDYNILTQVFKIPEQEITFREDAWQGGGSFGTSLEFFVKGLELGNCVFTEFEGTPENYKPLKTKVIDMGAGLERFAWLVNGTPTDYDVTFGTALDVAKRQAGIHMDMKVLTKYAQHAGGLNFDEVDNLNAAKQRVAEEIGVDADELFHMLEPLQAIYAILDHTKTILFTTHDGSLPSNSGGGYYLRYIIRRMFSLIDKNNLDIDLNSILEAHARYLKPLHPELQESVATTQDLLSVEKEKYDKSLKQGRSFVIKAAKQALKENLKEIPEKMVVELYESHGMPVEEIREILKKEKLPLSVPEFAISDILSKKNTETQEKKGISINVEGIPETRKLYYEDQYMKECDAKIIKITPEHHAIVLDQTCFYPEGGGQDGDQGYMNNTRVIDTQKVNNVILHILEDISRFKEGQTVHLKLDWERRIALMRHHTGAHVLTAAARKVIGEHVWQAGAHKSPEKAHMDLTHYKKLSDEELRALERQANEIIMLDIPLDIRWMKRNDAEAKYGMRLYEGGAVPGKMLRVITIPGWDTEACGGTHVSRTGELGLFKIIRRIGVQDGRERIEFVCGKPALNLVEKEETELKRIGEMLGCNPLEASINVKKNIEELKAARKEIEKQTKSRVQSEVPELLKNAEKVDGFRVISIFKAHTPVSTVLKITKELSKEPDLITVIGGDTPAPFIICTVGEEATKIFNAGNIVRKITAKCNGKGGGKENFAQGRVNDIEKLKEIIKQKSWIGD